MEMQIKIMTAIAAELDKKLQDMQSQVLSQIEGKLKTASLVIEQLSSEKKAEEKKGEANAEWKHDDRDLATTMKDLRGMGKTKKATYVVKKNSLIAALDEIEKWQQRYDPGWILIMKMSGIPIIDQQLDEQQEKAGANEIPIITAAKGVRDVARATQESKDGDKGSIFLDGDKLKLDPTSIPNSSEHISKLTDEKTRVLSCATTSTLA